MGWKAYYRDGTTREEDVDGRPVQDGEEGKLALITQEDVGHKVAVDLLNGIIYIDYDYIDFQGGNPAIANPKLRFFICDETNIAAELFDLKTTEPDEAGWYSQEIVPLIWRPIWFTRVTNGIPTKVIGAQTTLPQVYGGKNVKKLVSLFIDGRIGID